MSQEQQIAANAAAIRNLAARLERKGFPGDCHAEAEHIAPAERRRLQQRNAHRRKVLARNTWPAPTVMDDRVPFRLWRRIEEAPDGCWLWRGSLNAQGYGVTTRDKAAHRIGVHRLVYELLVGSIPEGLEPDHVCRNRACCNPDHMEPVTHRENILRGDTWGAANAAKTHCKYGHELAGDNLKLVANGRQCRQCTQDLRAARRVREGEEGKRRDAERARAYRARKRAEREAAA